MFRFTKRGVTFGIQRSTVLTSYQSSLRSLRRPLSNSKLVQPSTSYTPLRLIGATSLGVCTVAIAYRVYDHYSLAAAVSTLEVAQPASALIEEDAYLNLTERPVELVSPMAESHGFLYHVAGFGRALWLLTVYTPLLFSYPVVYMLPRLHSYWYRWLVWTLSHTGPCTVKLGQWMSERPDIFPVELCQQLGVFHHSCAFHSFPYTRSTIEEQLGVPLEDIFSEFSKVPVASGSVAQVHKAKLKECGSVVAVKVLHPYVRLQIDLDCRLLQLCVNAFCFVLGSSMPLEAVAVKSGSERVVTLLQAQLDLRREARNLDIFRRNFADFGEWRVSFPRPFHDLCAEKVLVETFVHGHHISHIIPHHVSYRIAAASSFSSPSSSSSSPPSSSLSSPSSSSTSPPSTSALHRAASLPTSTSLPHPTTPSSPPLTPAQLQEQDELQQRLKSRLARIGLNAYLKMMLVDNFVHADLHPGNMMYTTTASAATTMADGCDSNVLLTENDIKRCNIVFFDVGLTVELNDYDRLNFVQLFSCIASGNGKKGAELIVKRSPLSFCKDIELFKEDLALIVNKLGISSISHTGVGPVMSDIINCCRKHGVALDGNFATMVTATAVLEGVGRSLDPSLNVFKEAIPFILQHNKNLLPTVISTIADR